MRHLGLDVVPVAIPRDELMKLSPREPSSVHDDMRVSVTVLVFGPALRLELAPARVLVVVQDQQLASWLDPSRQCASDAVQVLNVVVALRALQRSCFLSARP